MLVSIVIPTRNAEQMISRCLSSLVRQTYSEIQLIVVDNDSKDRTREASESFTNHIYVYGPERGAQKNFGAVHCDGDAILFVDADMELSSEVVAECVEALRVYDVIMIPEVSLGNGFWNECIALERSCYVGDNYTEAARCFRREVFEQLGGFDESLVASGDDMDLSQRARRRGYRLGRIKACIIHHEAPRTPKATLLKWRYYGRNMGRYIRKNPREAFFQYLPIRPAWLRHWRRLVVDPFHSLGFLLLKACQFVGVVVGQIEAAVRRGGNLQTDPYRVQHSVDLDQE